MRILNLKVKLSTFVERKLNMAKRDKHYLYGIDYQWELSLGNTVIPKYDSSNVLG